MGATCCHVHLLGEVTQVAMRASEQFLPGSSTGVCSWDLSWLLCGGLAKFSCISSRACTVLQHLWVPGGSEHFAVGVLEVQPGPGVGYLHGGGFSSG